MNTILRTLFRISRIGIMSVLLCCVATASVSAAETSTLGIFPTTYDDSNPLTRSWFIYNLQPKQTKTDSFTVVNNSTRSIDVILYPVDATTTRDGAFALKGEQDPREGIGTWVKLSTSRLHLKPSERQQVPFTITIPNNKIAGDYAGGIIVQESVSTPSSQGKLKVNIVSRVGVRIYETIPGAQQASLEITNFSRSKDKEGESYAFNLKNTGNVILYPTGTLTTKGWNGLAVQSSDLASLGSLFPGKDTAFRIPYKFDTWFIDHYQATLNIHYGPRSEVETRLSYYSVNWVTVLPTLALIIGLVVLIIRRRRRIQHKHRMALQSQPSVLPTYQPITLPTKSKRSPSKRKSTRTTKPTKSK